MKAFRCAQASQRTTFFGHAKASTWVNRTGERQLDTRQALPTNSQLLSPHLQCAEPLTAHNLRRDAMVGAVNCLGLGRVCEPASSNVARVRRTQSTRGEWRRGPHRMRVGVSAQQHRVAHKISPASTLHHHRHPLLAPLIRELKLFRMIREQFSLNSLPLASSPLCAPGPCGKHTLTTLCVPGNSAQRTHAHTERAEQEGQTHKQTDATRVKA